LYTIRLNDDLTVTTFDRTHNHHTVNLRHHGRIARVTGLKQFSYTGQTSGDIPQLTEDTRDLHNYLSGFYIITFFYDDMASGRQVI
jgi:hypothetical protein